LVEADLDVARSGISVIRSVKRIKSIKLVPSPSRGGGIYLFTPSPTSGEGWGGGSIFYPPPSPLPKWEGEFNLALM